MTDNQLDIAALREANNAAAEVLTAAPRRAAALAYLRQRGFPADAISPEWPLGYAPPGWTRLVTELRGAFPDDVLQAAGVARRSSRGTLIDAFRDRVIFPVHERWGDVAGFIGRDLSGAPDAPKYLNTARSPLYDKSALLYGLYESRGGEQPVVVEGPLDVIALHAAQSAHGTPQLIPVASCGTAFTAEHARLVASAAIYGECVVAMDGDAVGRSAATSAGEQLRHAGLDVRVAVLPNGLDPAAYLAQPDPDLEIFQARTAWPLIAFAVERTIAAQGDHLQWVEGRVTAARSIASYLATYSVKFSTAQIGWISHALDIDPTTMSTELAEAYVLTARDPEIATVVDL